ncbi:MAG: tripartite tricarboxylate transporter substrate binding protein [Granulosicoccus sp.]
MFHNTRATIVGAVAFLASSVALASSCPEGYPGDNLNFFVGYGAGGGTDTVARKVASDLEKSTGWTVVVENKPGASGGVMASGLTRTDPDGLTIGVVSNTTVAINPHVNPDIGYTHEDFSYLGTGMVLNYGLVTLADNPFSTLEEFVAMAKEKGRATVSVGASSHTIAVDAIADHFDISLIAIPGKGSAAALQEALGGHVDATIQGTQHVPQIKAGKMVQLATLTENRALYAPDAKTLQESGVDLSIEGHIIFIAPKGTPTDIAACLSESLAQVTASDDYASYMAGLETTAGNMGADGTTAWVSKASEFYREHLAK